MKWGISSKQFMHGYLHIGEPFLARLPEVKATSWQRFKGKLKSIISIITGK
jgi:hypothetical protein